MSTQYSHFQTAFGFSECDLEEGGLDELLNQFSLTMRSHSRRVAVSAAIMAEYAKESFHWIDAPTGMNLAVIAHLGGLCHDVGKLLMPALATSDVDYMRHPVYGAELLERHKKALFSNEEETGLVLEMVRYHHERPDGSGFPYGLRKRSIPLTAGICAVADSLDHRIYSEPRLRDSGAAIFCDIKAQEGTLLYESAVDCFEQAWPRLMEQYARWDRSAG